MRTVAVVLTLSLCAVSRWSAATELPSFPGAEGFGATASGGRGGDVVYVTNLNDRGPGSLRDALRGDDRMILFKVSGTFDLQSKLDADGSNITIAGQSAPGDGICLRGKDFVISGDNIIVRFLRFRPGDERGEEHDALTVWGGNRVMVDHCSLSWSTDSLCDVVRDSSGVTVQWCLLAEPLNKSVHAKGAHGYGTGWGSGPDGGNSYHHNLIADCNSRAPRIGSEQHALVDVRNNVIYNRGEGWAYGGEHARVNYVGNFLKPGPSTKRPGEIFRFSSPATRMYLRDNVVFRDDSVSGENALGLAADEGVNPSQALVSEPFEAAAIETEPAERAYERMLEFAGATLPQRDAVDNRIVGDARSGSGRIVNSQNEVGGWPTLHAVDPPLDTDADGLPDAWEVVHNLDPNTAADGADLTADGYSNLEHYLNELAAAGMPPTNAGAHHSQSSNPE